MMRNATNFSHKPTVVFAILDLQADIVRKQRIEFEEAMEDLLLQVETKRKLGMS